MADERIIGAVEIDRLYDFLDGLQASGYTIDPRQYLALSDLLMALIARGDSLEEVPLKTLIAPLICSTPAEQQDFYQRFDRWYPTLLPVKQASLSGDDIYPPSQPKRRWSLPTINRTAVIWVTGVVAVIALIVWLISNSGATGTQVINSTVSLYGATFAVFGFMVWLIWRASVLYQENQYITRELANQEPVYTKVPVQAYIQDVMPVMQFKPIVSSLRKRTQSPSADVDVDRTIENALNRNNWLEIVYRQRQVVPEYVVLIDRKSRLDQQARFVQEVLVKLEADGVWLHQYEFSGDPRVCFQFDRKDSPLRLKELQARHPDSRLLVFSSTNEFINPLTGLFQDWIESFSYWQERAILTPDTLQKVLLEELESRDFAILPMTFDGLASLVRAFETDNVPLLTNGSVSLPAQLIERPIRWTGRDTPPEAEVKALVEAVKNYLGENGFYWLCATAVYPELRWEMTLYLGSVLQNKKGQLLLNPENLLRLTHLPWFRLGYMPDWFRLALIGSMSETEDSEVRGILGTLLESAFQPKDNPLDLLMATKQSVSLSERSKKVLRFLFSGRSTESELHDYIFLRFLLKKDQKQLAVLFNRLSNRLGLLFEVLGRLRANFRVWQQTRELSRKSKFYWLEPNEVIYNATRMHPIALMQKLVLPILLLFAPIGIFYLWFLLSLSNLILIAAWALLIIILLWITWQVLNWFGMYFILTNKRVVSAQSLVGAIDTREESPLKAILSVNVEVSSLGRQLKFGDVVIRTFVGMIRFVNIADPDGVARMVEDYWGVAKEQSTEHEKELMRDTIRTRLGIPTRQTTRNAIESELIRNPPDFPETLQEIAMSLMDILNCDLITLYPYDEEKDEVSLPTFVGNIYNPQSLSSPESVGKNSFVYSLLKAGEIHISLDAQKDSSILGPFVQRESIVSSIGIPLVVGATKVGVLFAIYRTHHEFSEEEIDSIKVFASQAALAIQKATLLDKNAKSKHSKKLLDEANTAITESIGLGSTKVVDKLLEIACNSIEGVTLGTFQTLNEQTNELELTNIYPSSEVSKLRVTPGEKISLVKEKNIGVVGRSAVTKRTQRIGDVSSDRDYIMYLPSIKSELAIPVLDRDRVLGVLNVESEKVNAFDGDDADTLQALANLAVVALKKIEKSEQTNPNRHRVLVVENDSAYLETLKEFLENEFNVSTANNPKEALQLIQRQKKPFQVVITDLRLINDDDPKDESGLSLIKEIRSLGERAQIIVLTSYPTVDSVRKAIREYSVFNYVSKNSGMQDLREIVRKAAGQSNPQNEEKAALEEAILIAEETERQRIAKVKKDHEAAEKSAYEKARLEAEKVERESVAKLSREQKNTLKFNDLSQETEITIWGPTQSGKDWLLKGFAKELEEHTLRSEDFIFDLRERRIGGTNFSFIKPEPPRFLEPTSSPEDYILSFSRRIKPTKTADNNKLSTFTHYINFHNNRGSDLISAILEPNRFDFVFNSIVRSQYILITLDPSFDNKESIPNINAINGKDYPLVAVNSGLNKENYFKILTLFLDTLSQQNTPKKYLAFCITKTDSLKSNWGNSWDLLELIFGQKIFRLLSNYRSVFNMEVFATSAAGYVIRKGANISNYSNGKLLDHENWKPFNCAAPFFWLFENREIERIKFNSNFLNRETNLRNYIRYPRPRNI